MWLIVVLALAGVGYMFGVVLGWWATVVAPVTMILGAVAIVIITGHEPFVLEGSLERNLRGALYWVIVLGLSPLVGAVCGTRLRAVSHARHQ